MKPWIKWGIIGAIVYPVITYLVPAGIFGIGCLLPVKIYTLCESALQSRGAVAGILLYNSLADAVGQRAAFWLWLLVVDVIIGFAIGALLAKIITAVRKKAA